jgi:hypothetical protein
VETASNAVSKSRFMMVLLVGLWVVKRGMVRGGYGNRLAFRGGNIVLEIHDLFAEWIHFVSLRLALRLCVLDHFGGDEQAILLVLRVLAVELRVKFDKLVLLALATYKHECSERDSDDGSTHERLL